MIRGLRHYLVGATKREPDPTLQSCTLSTTRPMLYAY